MRKSIRKRLTITFIALAVGPLLLVGLILSIKTYTVQEQEAVALQREMARHLSARVLSFVKELESALQIVLQVQNFQKLDWQQQKLILSILLARQPAFDELILLDAAGRETIHLSRLKFYDDSTLGQQMDTDAFRVPMSQSVTYYSPVRFKAATGEPLMILALPIHNLHTGSTEGVLVADVRLKEIWNLVARLRPGPKGDSYIVDSKNRVVAHRNPSVVLRGTQFDPPDQDGIHPGLNGDKAVLVSEKIDLGDQRFHIVVENPISEAMALAFETIWLIASALAVLSVVAGGLGIVAVRKIVYPIQDLANVARQIQAGQLTKQATTGTQDEIGELAEAFNRMTRKLTDSMENLRIEVIERKRTQEALQESEEKYRVLFQTFPLGISITDKDGNIREVNRVSERILETSIQEHTQRSYGSPEWKIIRPDGSPMPIEEFAGVRAKKENRTIKNVEMGIVKENGEITWLNVTAAPIPLMGYGEAITYQDVTRRKDAELELERHREHLEEMIKERSRELEAAQDELLKREKLSVLGQLTATVSHELRNPLGVIRSSAFYLGRKLQDRDEKVVKHLTRIDAQVGVCDRIVEDLLEYTRGKQSETIRIEFKPWIEDVLDQIITPDKVELVQGFSTDLPLVPMDREKMQRVVINLMNNAILAVNERQKPEIENEGDEPYQPRIRLAARNVDGGVVIEVEDNGVGMNAETVQKAFDPLFTTRARGTGLGLAIVRKIVEEHGGGAFIESKPNRGTKVTVNLPTHHQKNCGEMDES